METGESRLKTGATIVIDLGKTLSKVTLWDADGRLLDRQVRQNGPVVIDGVRRLDAEGIGCWLVGALCAYAAHPVEAIVPVGHGAGVVALKDGRIAVPPLDYEQPIPASVMEAYRKRRDPFLQTGSPALPDGLNVGSQLWWLELQHPKAMAGATLLPWAQYWAWFLSGVAVSEVTSLGCHSDLWCPAQGGFSPMARRLGWAEHFAPLARAGDTVGTLRPEIAAKTGLPPSARILAGLHDSNAALLAARGFPEIGDSEATVLSTGTWFIAMRTPRDGMDIAALPEGRDCLINVDVLGQPVPSARFMGGREIELLGARIDHAGMAGLADVLHSGVSVLPSHVPGSGPFPGMTGRWINWSHDADEQSAAVALYAALMADASLDLIGAKNHLLVEGRFAASEIFVRALATLRPGTQVFTAGTQADVSFGALRLVRPELAPHEILAPVAALDRDLNAYRDEWYDDMDAFA